MQDDTDTDEDFQFLQPIDLITKDVYELQKIIKEKKEKLRQDKPRGKDKDNNVHEREHGREPAREREKEKQLKEKEQDRDQEREKIEKDKEREKNKDKEKPREDPMDVKANGDKDVVTHEENGKAAGIKSQ